MSVNVNVLIVTYNRAVYLRRSIESIIKQSFPISKITVLNNCSDDNTIEILDEFVANGYPLTVINTNENLGSAGGFHVLIDSAKLNPSDWVWIMDDDVQPEANCLETMLKSAEGFDVVQPNRFNDDGSFMSLYSDLNTTNPFFGLLQGPVDGIHFRGELKNITFFPFEGPLIRWSMINLLEPPKRDYFIICDDLEYSYRVRANGGRAVLCGDALMRRQIMPSYSTNFDWKNYYDFRNRIFFDQEHAGYMFALIRGLVWMVRQTILSVARRRDSTSYKILFWATIHGFLNIKKLHAEILKISKR